MLAERGANVHHANTKGETALYHASKCGDALTIQILMEHGADMNQRNRKVDSAVGIGFRISESETVETDGTHIEPGASMQQEATRENVSSSKWSKRRHKRRPRSLASSSGLKPG